MMLTLDGQHPNVLSFQNYTLGISSGSEILVSRKDGPQLSAEMLDRPGSDVEVACWVTPRWVVSVGMDAHRLASFDIDRGLVRIDGNLARLDLEGYNPGGMHRVLFHPTPRGLLVETEVAVCYITRLATEWQFVHNDVTLRIGRVDSDSLVLIDENDDKVHVRLTDGAQIQGLEQV